jgi:hypothetical protein
VCSPNQKLVTRSKAGNFNRHIFGWQFQKVENIFSGRFLCGIKIALLFFFAFRKFQQFLFYFILFYFILFYFIFIFILFQKSIGMRLLFIWFYFF